MKPKAILAGVFFLAVFSARSQSEPPPPSVNVTCTFAHPSYSGKCRESASGTKGSDPKKPCASILACLNDTQCIKTFCQATTIRGGWTLESAAEEEEKK
jgi:hypothetical protein